MKGSRGPETASSDATITWHRSWATTTAAAAVLAFAVDAALLQRGRAYFGGGFLAVNYVSTAGQALAFVTTSLVADAAVAGVMAAIVLWVAARCRMRRLLAMPAALVAAVAPILCADAISYQLIDHLGDAVDLRLLFELTGRSPAEFFAVSSSQVLRAASIGSGLAVVAAAVAWSIRRLPLGGRPLRPVAWPRAFAVPLLLMTVATPVVAVARLQSDVLDNGLRRTPASGWLSQIVDRVSDFDGDGWGILGQPGDAALFDARIHPYAIDVPGDGIDEDGVAGDLPASATPFIDARPSDAPWRIDPDVVLILLESFRADAIGARVDGVEVTPVLDRLAANGVSAPLAYSHNGYTVQSRWHVLTGSLATLSKSSLVDDFKAHGYETGYFSAQDESFGGPAWTAGFTRADVAYDARADVRLRYSTFTTAGSLAVPYPVLSSRVGAFLDRRRRDRPLFLYVNFHDTHFPYHHAAIAPLLPAPVLSPSQIAVGRAADLREMYLNTAANVDRAIGQLLADVRRTTGRAPAVIVLGDHGESLFESGFLGHGYALNDAQTRIPLIISNLPATVPQPFGQSDLRGVISGALARGDAAARPQLHVDASRRVFQYLGTLDRPAAIAFVSSRGRLVYDFRSDRVIDGGAAPRRPDSLTHDVREEFVALVRTWERMRLARAQQRAIQ
jgi:glucan phosphoethanolaminetransferase (alkaline phosphatase superfamily)